MYDNPTTNQDTARLQRIIKVRLSLSLLFERLLGLPRPIRHLILWILRPAERIAHNFVINQACARGVRALPACMFEPRCRNSYDEARRLADCFHDMIWALEMMTGLRAQRMGRGLTKAAKAIGLSVVWPVTTMRKFMQLGSPAGWRLGQAVKIDSS